jgi:hypothetical protein
MTVEIVVRRKRNVTETRFLGGLIHSPAKVDDFIPLSREEIYQQFQNNQDDLGDLLELCKFQTGIFDLAEQHEHFEAFKMNQVRVFHDRLGNSLIVWFGNPEDEYEVEETGDEVLLMKNREGRVIGFEKLNFLRSSQTVSDVIFQAVTR